MQQCFSMILIVLLALLPAISMAQGNPCEVFLNKAVPSITEITNQPEQFKQECNQFLNCGLDALEVKYFFSGPMIGAMLQAHGDDEGFSYGQLLEKINHMKSRSDYPEVYRMFQFMYELDRLPANVDHWPKDKLMFQKMGMAADELRDLERMVLAQADDVEQTYMELMRSNAYSGKDALWQHEGIDMQAALAKGKRENKPVLFYLTESGSEDSRKMEEEVFVHPGILDMLNERFVFVPLRKDDDRLLPEGHPGWNKESKEQLQTYGQYYAQWQLDTVKEGEVPFFVIFDHQQNISVTFDYTKRPDGMKMFLDLGLENFKK